MKVVGLKQDLSDAEESLVEDQKFLAELEKGCATKEVNFDKVLKMIDDMVALLKQEKLDDDHGIVKRCPVEHWNSGRKCPEFLLKNDAGPEFHTERFLR